MNNITVFGSSGFVGQHLQKVFVGSNSINLRNENWQTSIPNDTQIFVNLVGKAHDHNGKATERDFYFANVELTKKIFNSFLASNAKLMIHISSIAALEEFESRKPLLETDVCNPFSLYGKSKRAGEKWLLEQNLPHDKKVIILRPPMIHGEGDKGNLGLLYKLISKGIPYPLSSFDNHRSFISIDNFIYFVKNIIDKFEIFESEIYHISDDEPISTNKIIDIIKKVENKKVMNLSLPKSLVIGLAKVGDIFPLPLNSKRLKKMTSDLIVSNQKIKTVLGIDRLPLTAEQGLEKTIKSFNMHRYHIN